MIDREMMLEIAKASGIKFGSAQFTRGVLEAEISEFDLEAYTAAVAQKAAEAERDSIEDLRNHDDVLAPVGNSGYGEAYQDGWIAGVAAYTEAIRARGTGGAG